MADTTANSNTVNSGPPPYWWPEAVPIEQLPENLRAAVEGLIQPIYEKMVIAARPGPEQSTGATIVSLLWLEILQQTELGKDLLGAGPEPERLQEHEKTIGRLLRLSAPTGAAGGCGMCLARARRFRQNTGSHTENLAEVNHVDQETEKGRTAPRKKHRAAWAQPPAKSYGGITL